MTFRRILSALALLAVAGIWAWGLSVSPVCEPIADPGCDGNENAFPGLVMLGVAGSLIPAVLVMNVELDPARSVVWFRRRNNVRLMLRLSAIPWFLCGLGIWILIPVAWGMAVALLVASHVLRPERDGGAEAVLWWVSAATVFALACTVCISLSVWLSSSERSSSPYWEVATGDLLDGTDHVVRSVRGRLVPGDPSSTVLAPPPAQTLSGFDGARTPRCPASGELPNGDPIPFGPCAEDQR